MRPMVLKLLTVASLLLCLSFVALWVRSLGHVETLVWNGPARFVEAESIDGVLELQWTRDSTSVPPVSGAGPLGSSSSRFAIPPGRDRATLQYPRISRFGLGFHVLKTFGPPFGLWRAGNRRFVIAYVPFWLLAGLTATLPLRWLVRRLRSRSSKRVGFCAHCGYNLTGNTSGICPECGLTISEARAVSGTRSRRLMLAIAAVALAVLLPFVWQTARQEYRDYLVDKQLFAHQQRYLNYSPPSDLVTYDEDPADRSRLLASSRNYVPIGTGACYLPDVLDGPLRMGFGNGPPILFMHRRQSPDGTPFLVVVTMMALEDAEDIRVELHGPVIPDDYRLSHWGDSQLVVRRWPAQHMAFLSGQPDPADPSHFTIGYRVGGKAGNIEGWVLDDATVKMQVRDGPVEMLSTSAKPRPIGMKWGGSRSGGTH